MYEASVKSCGVAGSRELLWLYPEVVVMDIASKVGDDVGGLATSQNVDLFAQLLWREGGNGSQGWIGAERGCTELETKHT